MAALLAHTPEAPAHESIRIAPEPDVVVKSVIVIVADPPLARRPVREWLARNPTVVLFALMLASLDVLLGQFAATWQSHSPDDYVLRVEGCRSRPRDLVFVGGSPVAEGIDPERIAGLETGGTSLDSRYALGLSGGTTSDFYHAVIHACPTPPRVLVYGITASDLNDSRHEPHGPYSLMTWGDLLGWLRLRPETAEWVTRHFLQSRLGQASNLYHYRHGIRMWLASQSERVVSGSCPEAAAEAAELRHQADTLRTGNGYVPAKGFREMRYDAVKAAGLPTAPFAYLSRYRTGSHLKYLHRLIDWCSANGVRLVLLDMPVTADLEAKYAAEFAEFRGRLAEVERDRGVAVIRGTREATGLNDAHFADLIHMNGAGARLFSDWVRGQLDVVLSRAAA